MLATKETCEAKSMGRGHAMSLAVWPHAPARKHFPIVLLGHDQHGRYTVNDGPQAVVQKNSQRSWGHATGPCVYIGRGRKKRQEDKESRHKSRRKHERVFEMTKTNNDARHMNQYASRNNGMRGRIVAIALAGVLAVGGVAGAVCAAGLGKAPNQAPVAAQTVTTRPVTKAASTQKVAKTKKAEAKKATETKKATEAKQAEAVKPAAKQAEATKQAAPAATKQAETKAPTADTDSTGLEAKISREDCIAKACAHVGAGGQAKGEAKNVTAKKVVGGGTVYYAVELDLGDVHYCVQVDAIDGDIIGSDQVHAGTRTLLDREGNPIEGTEQEA